MTGDISQDQGLSIGERIKLLRGNESRDTFCSRFSKSKQTIIRYENNQFMPDADFVRSLCRYYAVSADWIIFGADPAKMALGSQSKNGIIDDGYVMVPRVATELAAGVGSFVDSTEVVQELAFRRDWLKTKGQIKDMVIMTVQGDSMEPTLKDKDIALINLAQTRPSTGLVYAVGHDDALYIKRLVVEPGCWLLRSDNSQYRDIVLNHDNQALMDQVKIIGRAVWWCHDERT